jgi:hypothetical protein
VLIQSGNDNDDNDHYLSQEAFVMGRMSVLITLESGAAGVDHGYANNIDPRCHS